jgi:hypothetical protein
VKPRPVIGTDEHGRPIFAGDTRRHPRDDDWREALDKRARTELDKRLAKLGIRLDHRASPRSTPTTLRRACGQITRIQ